MPSSIDLINLPLIHSNAMVQTGMPGFYAATPPRRAARGRSRDRLILYLSWPDGKSLQAAQITPLLERLARVYFRSSGTVTSAQRAVVAYLNQTLLDRNIKEPSSGQQVIGWLTQVVVRDDHLFLGQSGLSHTFILIGNRSSQSSESKHIYDPQLSGRGLGLSRTAPIRFSQAELKPGDVVLLTSQPPDSWTAALLQNAHNQGADNLRRWIFDQGGSELTGVLIQVQPGTGKLETLKPEHVSPARSVSKPLSEDLIFNTDEFFEEDEAFSNSYQGPGVSETWIGGEQPSAEAMTITPIEPPRSPEDSGKTSLKGDSQFSPGKTEPPNLQSRSSSVSQSDKPLENEKTREKIAGGIHRLQPFRDGLKSIGMILKRFIYRLLNGVALLLKAILPDAGLFKLPPSTMAFFAIAVPLVVVTVASLIYLQRGQAIYYDYFFKQALESAAIAETLNEPQDLHLAWTATLKYLEQAELHGTTPESQTLRTQAVQILDSLDFVERLDFSPALTTKLNETAHISRMVSTDSDLYLLNSREGVVLRATYSNTGYVIDPFFKCGPGAYGSFMIGAIADIVPLPRMHELKATVLGIDANGNLLYCIPGEDPLAQPLAPPDTNWGTPEGVAYDSGDLYILDPKTNGVWIYRNMEVSQQPRFFFDQQVPPMQDVIDLAVNRSDLYLLHTDGHLTTCTYSALVESPTRCEEPAIFIDPRPGRQDTPIIEGAYFTEVLFAHPPDPSIYLLEPGSQAIYHFSVRLTFQRQFQSSQPLPDGPATAFTLSHTNRTVFIAIGNEVFYATLP